MKRVVIVVAAAVLSALLVSITSIAQPLNPHGGGGSATNVIGGSGLGSSGSAGGITLSVGSGSGITVNAHSIAIDPTYSQRRIGTGCSAGSALQTVNQDGSVTCGAFGSGTITSVLPASGGGLAGGGSSGALTMSLLMSCSPGNVLAYNGTAWACGPAGITNGAGANVIPKSDGTNLVASSINDNGTTVSTAEAVSITGPTTVASFLGTPITPTTITGTVNDYAPTSLSTATDLYIASSSGVPTITGLTGGVAGRRITIHNVDASNNLLIACNNASSLAANRITGPWGTVNLPLNAGENGNVTLEYNGTSSRWRVIGYVSSTYPTMTVAGAFVGSSTGSFGGALNMNSHQINNVTNGASAQDAAAFGQIASGVNTAVSGATGSGARFSGTNTIASAAQWDNGTYTTQNETADGTTINNTAFATNSTEVDNFPFPASKRTVVLNTVGTGTLLTGIAAPSENMRRITIANNSTAGNCMSVYDDNPNSTITNRIKMEIGAGGAAFLCPQGTLDCFYDPNLGTVTPGRWSCAITWAQIAPYSTLSVLGDISITGNFTGTGGIHTTGGISSDSSGITSGAGISAANGFAAGGSSASNNFTNSPVGGTGAYTGTHIEGVDEWMDGNAGFASSTYLGNGYLLTFSGAGVAGTVAHSNTNGRPGVLALGIGTGTAGGLVQVLSDTSALSFSDGNWSYEWIGNWPTLSSASATVASMYTSLIGFTDTSINPVDGCYFLYDKGNASASGANTTNLDDLGCACASNNTRTQYVMKGTGNSDESFPLGTAAITAATYVHLSVVMTGTTRAEFFVNGTKKCDINTNVPSGNTRVTGYGFTIDPQASSGTGARSIETDWTKFAVDLTSVRSP